MAALFYKIGIWEEVEVGDTVTVLKGSPGTEGHYRDAFLTAERLGCFMDTYSPPPYDSVVYSFYQLHGQQYKGGFPATFEEKHGKHVGEAYLTGAVIIEQKALSGNIVRVSTDDHQNEEVPNDSYKYNRDDKKWK